MSRTQLKLLLSRRPPVHRVTLKQGMQPPELIKALSKLPPGTMLRSAQGMSRYEPGVLRFGEIEGKEES